MSLNVVSLIVFSRSLYALFFTLQPVEVYVSWACFCQVLFLLKGNSSFPLSPGGGPRASSDCWGSLSNIARSLLDYIKLCGGAVSTISMNLIEIEKLFKPSQKIFCSLVALHSEVEHFSGPKMFILISTIMTWACSKPADPVSVYNRNLTYRSLCICNIYLNL